MRPIAVLALLSLAAAPAAAQGILLPAGCEGTCPAQALEIDSVQAWADLNRGQAGTFISYVFRNRTDASVDGAFFFPLPSDAELAWATVSSNGRVDAHNQWSGPDESRRILDELTRGRPEVAMWNRRVMVHVPIPAIPAHGVKRLQIHYTQPLGTEAGVVRYAYPLSLSAPAGHLTLGVTVKTETGFQDLHSPSHAVNVQWGTESARCPPQMRCGFRGVTSHRVKIVRLIDARREGFHDFELLYTPAAAQSRRVEAHVP